MIRDPRGKQDSQTLLMPEGGWIVVAHCTMFVQYCLSERNPRNFDSIKVIRSTFDEDTVKTL